MGLSFFLLLGSVSGSIFCNFMNEEMKQGLVVTEQTVVTAASLAKIDYGQLFLRIAPKRIWTLILIFLASAVSMAPALLMLVAGYWGFSMSVMICSLTMGTGFAGIEKYAVLMFPHGVIYLVAGYVLLWWMPSNGKRLTVLSMMFLSAVVLVGAAAETIINPWVVAFFGG